MAKRHKKRKLRPPNWFGISIIIGLTIGIVSSVLNLEQYFEANHDLQIKGIGLQLVAVAACFYFSAGMTIFFHQIGHLIAGSISGYRFVFLRFGKLTLTRLPDGSLGFRWFAAAGSEGQCGMVSPDPLGKPPYKAYLMGGGVLNIITAVLALVLSKFFPLFSVPLWIFGGFSVVSAVYNLFPNKNPSVPTDGAILYRCKNDPESLRAFLLQLSITDQLARGKDLSEQPLDWFYTNVSAPMTSDFLVSGVWLCTAQRMLLKGRLDEALPIFDKLSCTTNLLPSLKCEAALDTIFCLQLLRKFDNISKVKINKRMQKYIKTTQDISLSRFRHRYATHILVDEAGDGKEILQDFEDFILSYPFAGEIKNEQKLIEKATQEFISPTVRPVKLRGYP